jgi:N-formylmaleamate deformylase
MPTITANGIQIHYERTGGDKPPVVLLHGITDSGQCWPRLVAALKDQYDLIGLDARAHGLSDAPPSGYTYENMATDVAGVIAGLELVKPAAIGHSMGAMTAGVLGALFPDIPARMVLEDPPWREKPRSQPEREADAKERRDLIIARHSMTMDEMIAESYTHQPTSKLWDKSEFAPWSEAKKHVNEAIVQLTLNAPPLWRNFVPRITCPTLLITSDPAKGGIVTPAVAAQVAALNPKISIVTIPEAGHNIRREAFDHYLAAVRTFLAGA